MYSEHDGIFSSDLQRTAQEAVRRVIANLRTDTPSLSSPFLQWLATHCDTEQPETYFVHPNALTLFPLPWWLEQALRGTVDTAFQCRLMGSSTNLYYFARMLDDLMDGHPVEKVTLPVLYSSLLNFQKALFQDFPASHGFWEYFHRYVNETAEAASVDLSLMEIDEGAFVNVAARKTAAALIPLSAVCCRYQREDALPVWEDYFRAFACWHQFRNDLLGWADDLGRGARTWLLCEADRCKRSDESIAMWMGREGFKWAGERLSSWMTELKQKASHLNSPELLRYLDLREKNCAAEVAFLAGSAAAWARLLETASTNG
jgi:hypothetical protein